jgi:hypothetical protein
VQLRQGRDHWYEIVGTSVANVVEAFAFQEVATNDVQPLISTVDELCESLKGGIAVGTSTVPEFANVAFGMVNTIAPQPDFAVGALERGFLAPGRWPAGTVVRG